MKKQVVLDTKQTVLLYLNTITDKSIVGIKDLNGDKGFVMLGFCDDYYIILGKDKDVNYANKISMGSVQECVKSCIKNGNEVYVFDSFNELCKWMVE